MEELEYNQKLKELEEDFKKKKQNLQIMFAKSKRRFKIGDIIKNGSGDIIKIESFGTSVFYGLPIPIYNGPLLKKDLTPRKSGEKDSFYESMHLQLITPNQ